MPISPRPLAPEYGYAFSEGEAIALLDAKNMLQAAYWVQPPADTEPLLRPWPYGVSVKGAKVASDLAMDETARLARAKKMGFRTDQPLYHGTPAPDFPAFSTASAGRSTGQPTVGVWVAETPEVANAFARAEEGTGRVIPLLGRSGKHGNIALDGREAHHEIMATVQDAFDRGYDALRLTNYRNYSTAPDAPLRTVWVFKDPNQLRSRFAAFDPARKLSPDLLARHGGRGRGRRAGGRRAPLRRGGALTMPRQAIAFSSNEQRSSPLDGARLLNFLPEQPPLGARAPALSGGEGGRLT